MNRGLIAANLGIFAFAMATVALAAPAPARLAGPMAVPRAATSPPRAQDGVTPDAVKRLFVSGYSCNCVLTYPWPTVPQPTPTPIAALTISTSTPWGIAISPVNHKLYVANFNASTITVYNPLTAALYRTFSDPGANPIDVAIAPNGDAYVGNSNLHNVVKYTYPAPNGATPSPGTLTDPSLYQINGVATYGPAPDCYVSYNDTSHHGHVGVFYGCSGAITQLPAIYTDYSGTTFAGGIVFHKTAPAGQMIVLDQGINSPRPAELAYNPPYGTLCNTNLEPAGTRIMNAAFDKANTRFVTVSSTSFGNGPGQIEFYVWNGACSPSNLLTPIPAFTNTYPNNGLYGGFVPAGVAVYPPSPS